MSGERSGLRVLDLYCGAGGFSEGFRQAGFDVVMGIDNWQTALDSHSINGLGVSLNYDMFKLVDDGGYEEAKRLALEIENEHSRIDVLIGSPPCTEFSYAKKGGKGDIEKGMLLVRAHLVMVAALQPKFWLMENVPRLKTAIEKESNRENSHGWYVDLERLGVTEDISDSHLVDGNALKVPYGKIYTASEHGAPQGRKRFIAGNMNPELVTKTTLEKPRTMGEILDKLKEATMEDKKSIKDPNYPRHRIRRELLRDHFYDTRLHPMYWEELRHLKRRHIQYGRMAIPDELDRPARTIMATSNPSSREAVTLETSETMLYQGKKRPILRQPTVREVACIQGFPISFQFSGPSLTTRYKQIGNAVPCQLSHQLALGVLAEFERSELEDVEQQQRLEDTLLRMENANRQPIIEKPQRFLDEAKDFSESKYMEFRAKPDKHLRRRLLSAKPFNTSAVLVFENTEWTEEGKRVGGFWKSCIQLGQGKIFSQVYLDEKSVDILLKTTETHLIQMTLSSVQTTLESFQSGSMPRKTEDSEPEDALAELKSVLSSLWSAIDTGIPIVPKGWVEFPGYKSDKVEKYFKLKTKRRKSLPSAKSLQRFFTTHVPRISELVGPIDIFDGLDFLMLQYLQPKNWIHNSEVFFHDLHDVGTKLHPRRINRNAADVINGSLPLITIVGAFLSVHVLYRMHELDSPVHNPSFSSIKKGWNQIARWCDYERW